jgi:hypothetical protein
MQILLVDNISGKKHRSPLQKRFEKLYKQLERQKRLNERFTRELDELTNTFRQHTREADLKQLDTLIALAKKLICFASRKSLSDWHRNELQDWAEELIFNRITPLDPETAARLSEEYVESMAHAQGITTEELRTRVHEAFSNESKVDAAEDFEAENYQDDLFGSDDIPPDPDDWFRGAGETKPQHDEILDNWDLRDQVMDSTWLKTIFRRAAQNLHPDRESDTEKRQHKQEQLTALLLARKENDVLTMLKIYSEALNGQEIKIAEKEMSSICELLEEQLDDLECEQTSYIHSHPERHMVYELLYHSNQKKRQKAMQLWQKDLAEESEQNSELVAFLRNLSRLKEVLRERRFQRVDFVEWMMEDFEAF